MLASKQLQYNYNSFSACLLSMIAIAIIVLTTFYIDLMEVLLEYKGSRRLIQVLDRDISQIYGLLQRELNKVGWRGVILQEGPEGESSEANQLSRYILQKWTEKFQRFVDLVNVEDLEDGDVLTVVLDPGSSPQKVSIG